jgi:error-prone DNA polymerase
LLNSMPMGFYQPAQIVMDARNHGVDVRPVDVNFSNWDNTLEEKSGNFYGLRLGFRQVSGLREEDMQTLISGRIKKYSDINSLRNAGLSNSVLEKLADADAFNSMGLDRRVALWEVSTNDQPLGLFKDKIANPSSDENIKLPVMKTSEHVVYDYAATSLSLKAHPVSFVRPNLNQLRILPTNHLKEGRDGDFIKVAGLVLVRQRPGTASGVCFITIEDETGYANLVVFESIFEKFRKEILQSRLLMVEGKLQVEGEVIHVIVQGCFNLTKLLQQLTTQEREYPQLLTLARGDETSIPAHAQIKKTKAAEKEEEDIFHKGRNFR